MGFNDRDKLPFFLGPIHLGVSWVSSEAWGAGSIVSIGLPYCFAFLASSLWVGKPRPRRPRRPRTQGNPRESNGGLEMTRHWNQVLIYVWHQMDPNGICSTCFSVELWPSPGLRDTQHREERLRFGQRVGRRSAGQSVNFWGISIAQKIYSKKTHRKQNHTTPFSLLAMYHIKNLSYIFWHISIWHWHRYGEATLGRWLIFNNYHQFNKYQGQ